MKFTIESLPDDVELLKRMIVELQIALERQTDFFHEQFRLMQARHFGRKSEKHSREQDAPLLPIFDMPEPADDQLPKEKEQEEEVAVRPHTRKKPGRKPLPDHLPRVDVLCDIPEEEKVCACGCQLSRIGEEVSEQLDFIPAKVQVIRTVRPKYACRNCEGVEDEGQTVKIAPVPARILPKSLASAGLLAHVLTAKFVDALPFYRQEKQFIRLGVDVNRATMCGWAMKAAEACLPLLDLLDKEVLASPVVGVDETTLQVLKEKGRDPTTKSYMWIFRRGDPERPVVIYRYHPTRATDMAEDFLREYRGCVQTDGYQGYNFLDGNPDVLHAGCMAHARRKFDDIVKAQGKNRKKTGSADVALGFIARLYAIEKKAREEKLLPEQIRQRRQEEARPILEEFHAWMVERSSQTPPKGLLGKAISYALGQWRRLIVYLEDGRIPIDNNGTENAIRPFVIGRKNWLFSGTAEGARASAALYSLIETARANGLEPYSYLRYVFENLPVADTPEKLEALLPWNLDRKMLLAFIAAAQVGG